MHFKTAFTKTPQKRFIEVSVSWLVIKDTGGVLGINVRGQRVRPIQIRFVAAAPNEA